MYLVFDTETSNFPNNSLAPTHRNQGRIVQIAWVVLDEKFEEVSNYNRLFKVEGKFDINPGALEKHQKTPELCDREGIPAAEGLKAFNEAYTKAQIKVAFNIQFDRQLIDIEHRVLGETPPYNWSCPSNKCAMLPMTPICKLKGKYPGKWKWPKLIEAYRYCFQKDFDGAHDALADVRATAAVFKWLVTNGHKV
jgi:DNA polymerase-3 subunit epsilon